MGQKMFESCVESAKRSSQDSWQRAVLWADTQLHSQERKITQLQKMLECYQRTINDIDDYFEYTRESRKDASYVYNKLDNLSNNLKNVFIDKNKR